jgi:hypothetical protein
MEVINMHSVAIGQRQSLQAADRFAAACALPFGDASALVAVPFENKMIEGKPFGFVAGPVIEQPIEGTDGQFASIASGSWRAERGEHLPFAARRCFTSSAGTGVAPRADD